MTDSLYVVNRDDLLIGELPIRHMLTADPADPVYKLMNANAEVIPANMPDNQVANLFERNDWISAPVVDENRHLLGRITIDDVVDVIRDDASSRITSTTSSMVIRPNKCRFSSTTGAEIQSFRSNRLAT